MLCTYRDIFDFFKMIYLYMIEIMLQNSKKGVVYSKKCKVGSVDFLRKVKFGPNFTQK